jgi:hypothetical protein
MLSDSSQIQKAPWYIISFTCNVQSRQIHQAESRLGFQVFLGRKIGMSANKNRGFFESNKRVLKLDQSNSSIIL